MGRSEEGESKVPVLGRFLDPNSHYDFAVFL